ncbi:M20 family metallopeptidase [Nocardioides panacis]|uniref:M20 family metallopeptidase n=2 Tax=Nocardioides panacis TaxID=2849501 RepID=A0A975SXR9_9ACTN|nr:M20 family metallopeptidase [Nocardioides panacis]
MQVCARLAAQQGAMVSMLDTLVSSESPSNDPALLAITADLVADLGENLLGQQAEWVTTSGPKALRWDLPEVRSEAAPVVLLAHLDTVWPVGTLDRWPFSVTDDRATGPGAFDMKAGIVQAFFALAALAEAGLPRPPVVVLVTADEEIGSPAGRELVEAAAQGASAVLVLEASAGGALKIARKGVGNYWLHVTGRAAHAGLEPEMGVNALVAAAELVLALGGIADAAGGTTVTPTVADAGSAQNTVPATASIAVDVRAVTVAEQERVDHALRALRPSNGATVTVEGGINRPPLEERAAADLYALAQRASSRCGLPPLSSTRVGGGSDGNFTAALGVPTLDGLGAVGAGAHAEGEYVLTTAMPQRAALLAGLIVELARRS